MNKQELIDGMVVQLRNRNIYIKYGEMIHRESGSLQLKYYNESLTRRKNEWGNSELYDIIKVGKSSYDNPFDVLKYAEIVEWIWERPNYNIVEIDLRELTYFEDELSKYLITCGFQYLVRNKADRLMAYTLLPEYNKTGWITQKATDMKLVSKYLFKDLFTFLTYEGKEIYNLYNVIGVKNL